MKPTACITCGTENPPEEIFCGNCGVRLPKLQPKKEGDDSAPLPPSQPPSFSKPPPRKADPFSFANLLASLIVSAVGLAPFAAISAAAILALRLPPDTPPKATRDPHTSLVLEQQLKLVTHPTYQGGFSVTQKQINAFLATRQPRNQSVRLFGQDFQVLRQFVQLDSRSFVFGVEIAAGKNTTTLRAKFALNAISSQNSLQLESFFIGCLPVEPNIAQSLLPWYLPFADSYRPQLNSLSAAQSIKITPKEIEASWTSKRPSLNSAPLMQSSLGSSAPAQLDIRSTPQPQTKP